MTTIKQKIKCDSNYAEVIKNTLYFGNIKVAMSETELSSLKINTIVDLINYNDPSKRTLHPEKYNTYYLSVQDKPTNDINWCEPVAKYISDQINKNNRVYVHCSQGISRSSTIILYYLITREKKTLKESFDYLRKIRNVVCPIYGFMKGLSELENKLYGKMTFTPYEYSIFALGEVFPTIDKKKIEEVYSECVKIVNDNKEFYDNKMINENIEPVGYICYDKLAEIAGEENIVYRKGASVHHPFD